MGRGFGILGKIVMTFKKLSLISLLGLIAILLVREAVLAEPASLQVMAISSPALIEPAAGQAEYPPPPPASFNETLAETTNAMTDAIRISPSKSEVVHLDQDAASVIVSNPAHAAIMLDSPRVLIVLPRAPGATSFTVLDAAGRTIMERKVIVSNGREPYVRVRKICSGATDCAASSYFYCPDGCYEVSTSAISNSTTGSVPEIPASATTSSTPTTGSANDIGEEDVPLEEDESEEGTGESPVKNAPPAPAPVDNGGEQ